MWATVALLAGCGGADPTVTAPSGPAAPSTNAPAPSAIATLAPVEVARARAAWRPAAAKQRTVGALELLLAPDPGAMRGHLRVAFDAGSARDGEHAGISALVAASTCERLATRLARWGVTPRCTAAPYALVISVETLPGDAHHVLGEVLALPGTSPVDEAPARKRLAIGVDDPLDDARDVAGRLARRELLVLPLAPHPGAWRTAADLDEGPFGRPALAQFVRRHLAAGPAVVVATGAFDEAALTSTVERFGAQRRDPMPEPLSDPPPIDDDGGRRRGLLVARAPGGHGTVTAARRVVASPTIAALAAWSVATRAAKSARTEGAVARADVTVIDVGSAGALALVSLDVAPDDAPRAARWLDEAWAGDATTADERRAARTAAIDAARARASHPGAWAEALLAAELGGGEPWIDLPDEAEVELLAPRIDDALTYATKGDRLLVVDGPRDVAARLAEASGRFDELDPRAGLARRRTVAPAPAPRRDEPGAAP